MNIHKTITLSLVGITTCCGLVLTSVCSYADNDSAVSNASVTVPVSCIMSSTVDTAHNASLNPGTYSGASGSDYENGIGKTTLTTYCNDNNGFSIYAIGYTADNYGTTTLVGAGTGLTIPTKVYESTDTTSNWSMKVNKVDNPSGGEPITWSPENMSIENSFNDWHVVPDTYTQVAEYKANTGTSTTDTALGAKVETTYAAYISQAQAADTYTGKVKYTMVHPYDAEEPVSVMIQNYPAEQCLETPTRVMDSRDGTVYRIAKLADNRCWMLDNLALDLVNTDLNTLKGNTNASDTTLGYLKNGGGTTTDKWPLSGVTDWTGAAKYSIPLVNMSNKDATFKESTSTGVGDYKAGGYYNYCAASAGSYCWGDSESYYGSPTTDPNPDSIRDIAEDICPSGWHLPTISEISSNPGEFNNLSYIIGGSYNYVSNREKVALFKSTLSLPLAGMIRGGRTIISQGSVGAFWSSTWRADYAMYYLGVDASTVYPVSYNSRYDGYSIRCILGS